LLLFNKELCYNRRWKKRKNRRTRKSQTTFKVS